MSLGLMPNTRKIHYMRRMFTRLVKSDSLPAAVPHLDALDLSRADLQLLQNTSLIRPFAKTFVPACVSPAQYGASGA
jgi:hypothetical protein